VSDESQTSGDMDGSGCNGPEMDIQRDAEHHTHKAGLVDFFLVGGCRGGYRFTNPDNTNAGRSQQTDALEQKDC
jgi:hypothetical protein